MPGSRCWNRPAWPNISVMRSRSAEAKRSRCSSQNVAIVDFAQQRLHPLDRVHGLVEPRRIHGTADFQRVTQPLGGNPHGVVTLAVVRVRQGALALEQVVQASKNVPAGAGKGLWGPGVLGRRLHLPEDPLARPPHFPQNPLRLQTADRLDHSPLQPFAIVLQRDQHSGNARKTLVRPQRAQSAAEELDLHVAVAGVSQCGGDPADRLPPTFDLLAGEAAVEHPQRRPQPPRGHSRPVDELDVFGCAHPVQLLGKLRRLPADIPCGE